MAQERRLAALSRHLAAADLGSNSGVFPHFDSREVYLFLTKDNVELRARILDFLQVRLLV